MQTPYRVDTSTLGWVKSEIDQTLAEAREALARYVDGDDDVTPLRLFANNVHQVAGTLQMVELDGAARLAQETESLASAVVSGKVNGTGEYAPSELLDRGLSHLSSYMEKLAGGHPDRPIANVDVINELRRARQAEELDPFSFFHPDLEIYPSREKAAEELDGDQYKERVRELRRRFQEGLLKWLRGQDDEAWQALADVVSELYGLSRFQVSMQIWWVSRAYLDVLKSEELARDDPRKHALAVMDQLIRKLTEESEAAIAREGSDKLVRYMLYQIGCSEVRTDEVLSVIRLFELDTLLGAEGEQASLPEGAALASIRERVIEPLQSVQSVLDKYARSGERDDALAAADPRLIEIADAARDNGIDELADLSLAVRRVLFEGDTGEHSEESLMACAEALLFMEKTLDNPGAIGGEWRRDAAAAIDRVSRYAWAPDGPELGIESHEIDADALDAHELRRLVSAVAGQVEDNLKQAEHNLEQFSKDAGDVDSLAAIAESLQQVHGAVRMLGQHKLCDLLELALGQIEAMRTGDAYPTDALLDALAVTIGTTDAYVKGLEREAPNIDTLLNRAMLELESAVSGDFRVDADPVETLRRIHESFDVWIRDNADYEAFRTLRQSLRDIGAIAHQQEEISLRRIAQEMTNLLDIVTDDPSFLSEEVEETLRRSLSTLDELSASLRVESGETLDKAAGQSSAPPDVEIVDEDDDEIVREIFAEEAQECLGDIEAGLDALASDPDDTEVLTNVRRSFHTIKGSGRMARALDIAELAWVVEDTLNRCLEGDLAVSGPIIDFVRRAHGELNTLLAKGLDSSTDLQAWRRDASRLQSGDAGTAAPQTPATTRESGDSAEHEAAEPALTSIEELGEQGHKIADTADEEGSAFSDGEVIQIFSKEALSHIAAIRNTIDECNRRGEAVIGEELLRAVHTLQGNARSLHLVEMSEAYTVLDSVLNNRKSRKTPLYKGEMRTLDALLVATAKVLDHLNRDKRFPEVVRQELAEVTREIEESWGEPGGGASLELVTDFVSGPGREEAPEGPNVFDELEDAPRVGGRAPATEPEPSVPDDPDVRADSETDELKDVFLEEATDILSRFETSLQQGRRQGVNAEVTNTLKRELHTLKGSSRAAGMEVFGNLSHDAESMLEEVSDVSTPPADLLETLEEVHDTLVNMLHGIEEDRPIEADQRLIDRLRGGARPAVVPKPEAPDADDRGSFIALVPEDGDAPGHVGSGEGAAAPPVKAEQPEDTVQPAVETPRQPPGRTGGSRAGTGRATVRIRSNVLDKLVNYAGEVSISRSQLEEQLSGLKGNLNELRANVARFSDQVRELDIQADTQIRSRVAEEQVSEAGHDFDPLEMDRYSRLQQLSRSLSESLDDLVTIQSGLNRFASQTEGVLSQQALLNSELQDGLMSARMVPFNTLVPRLRHQVRQTARELSKEVDFTVTGGEVEVDRNILDQLGEALEHMIRNSLDHGIESVDARGTAGKPARGAVRIDCKQEGNEVVLKFSDDGAGLNVDRIKARAIEAGLMSEDADLTGDEVIQLIVLSGFSTAQSVTQLSGRGVGLDVVNDAVRRLGGSLTLDNRPGKGVTFELRLPLSLSITQAMFVRCGGQRFAIPLGVIETVLKTEPENLSGLSKDGDPLFKHDDHTYTLMDLTATLGLEPEVAGKRLPVLLVRMGARDVAVRVDELIETDEIVVKQLGDHLGRMSGINGATITGDGSVVLILDLAELWLAQERLPAFAHPADHSADAPPRVLVVDDSLTVRKVTGRNLGRHGMEVTMARDGLDALDQMARARPDLMLVDIEMPRMDGYELTSRIREDANYRDIPIIVITSRAGAKHREKAMELGADAYLTKPYQERELLEEVNALLNKAETSTVH